MPLRDTKILLCGQHWIISCSIFSAQFPKRYRKSSRYVPLEAARPKRYQNRLFKPLKAAKYELQKPSTCRATLFRCKFLSLFRVFHLAWSTWPATKIFVAGWRNAARWLVDLLGQEQICCATSCEFDEKRATKPKFVAQSRPALYFSQQLSSTCNKCFCCATSWSRKVKNGKHRRKLATKQCCATSWRFLYLVFRRLKATTNTPVHFIWESPHHIRRVWFTPSHKMLS